jgi:hypothetical protein
MKDLHAVEEFFGVLKKAHITSIGLIVVARGYDSNVIPPSAL